MSVTNITEFERTKPRETMKIINTCIADYQQKLNDVDVMLSNEEVVKNTIYTEILRDLQKIKQVFLSGK